MINTPYPEKTNTSYWRYRTGHEVGGSPEEAKWEWLSKFQSTYLAYHLEDKVISEGEGNVTTVVDGAGRTKRVTAIPAWHKDYVM
ncbi:hypothetical protein Tco_1141322 [Tanacetum coccineum]